jgi:hypothetical protein
MDSVTVGRTERAMQEYYRKQEHKPIGGPDGLRLKGLWPARAADDLSMRDLHGCG